MPGNALSQPYLPTAVLEQSSIRDKIAPSSLCAIGSASSHTSVTVVERSAKQVAVEYEGVEPGALQQVRKHIQAQELNAMLGALTGKWPRK